MTYAFGPTGLFGVRIDEPLSRRNADGVGLFVLVDESLAAREDGQRPEPAHALLNRTGTKVAAAAGLAWPGEFLDVFDRAAILKYHPGRADDGRRRFPRDEANLAGPFLAERLATLGRRTIVLGQRAAVAMWGQKALGVRRCAWIRSPLGDAVAVLPHPSSGEWVTTSEDVRAFLREHIELARACARR